MKISLKLLLATLSLAALPAHAVTYTHKQYIEGMVDPTCTTPWSSALGAGQSVTLTSQEIPVLQGGR